MRLKTHSFRFADEILNSKLHLKNEITSVLGSIPPISARDDRTVLHKQIVEEFKKKGWTREELIAETPLITRMKFDLFKEKVAIEVEASHIVHCYKDFLKFLVGFNDERIEVGALVVYADDYAKSLGGESLPTFGKVCRELETLFRSVIPVPILVIGLES